MKLRTLLVSLMLLIGALAPINAQVISQVQPGRNSAALSSSSTGTCLYTTDCNRINLGGYASVAVQLSGTWTGTATFETTTTVPGTAEASTTWVAVYLTPSNGSALTTTATTGGIWYGTVIGTQFRVRLTTPTGTMTSTIMTTLSAATNLGSSHTGSFLLADGTAVLPSAAFASHPSYGLFLDGNVGVDVSINGTARYSFRGDGLALDPTYGLEWTSGNPSSTNPDLVLLRDAANILALRNGTNAQLFNLYNTYTDASNYERVEVGANSGGIGANKFGVIAKSLGTGTARPLYIGTAGNENVFIVQNGSGVWSFNTSGNLADQGTHTITAGSHISAGATANLRWTGSTQLAAPSDGIMQALNTAGTGFTRLILGTNDATANGASWNLNSGVLESKTGDGSAYANIKAATLTTTTQISSDSGKFVTNGSGKLSTYSNVATAGWGVPSIVAAGRSTAQTAAVASVATYTVGAADGSFIVDANVLVTTATAHNFNVLIAYTDEGNTARSEQIPFVNLSAALTGSIINTGGAIPYTSIPVHIRAKASTAITISTSGTFTTVIYNVEGSIRQIS